MAQAERTLDAERRIHLRRPELMLNIAAVYERTGRTTQARALYTDVLARPDVAMDLPNDTTTSAHDLARHGLRQPDPRLVAAR